MSAETNIKSTSITNLDASPVVPNTSGQGASARLREVSDFAAVSATPIQSSGSYYRVIRFPTAVVPKRLYVAQNTEFDTHNSATLVLDFNVAFSDSTVDSTPATLQGLIPTSANTGATTSFASYSSPNLVFGQKTQVFNALINGDYAFNGLGSNYSMTLLMQPLWLTFGFASDPGGFFDFTAYASTGATTGAAGKLFAGLMFAVDG